MLMNQIDDTHRKNVEQLSLSDKEIQDHLHMLEFNKISAFQGYKTAKAIQDVMIRRRQYKNADEILSCIRMFAQDRKECVQLVRKLYASLNAKAEQQKNRVYTPRVLKDGDA